MPSENYSHGNPAGVNILMFLRSLFEWLGQRAPWLLERLSPTKIVFLDHDFPGATALAEPDLLRRLHFYRLRPQEVARRPLPERNWGVAFDFSTVAKVSLISSFFFRPDRCHVSGLPVAVFLPHGPILAEVSLDWKNPRFDHSLLHRLLLPRAVRLSGRGALLATTGGETYFHWLWDILPRLGLLEQAGEVLGSFDYFLVNQPPHLRLLSPLESMGISREKLIFLKKRSHFICDSLAVPSLPGPTGDPPVDSFNFLRRFLPAEPKRNESSHRCLMISRSRASCRRLLNEDAILAALRPWNFRRIFLEDFSFEDQVRLFHQADIVISPHGAGLANLAFCRPGTKVFELFGSEFNPCYWAVASGAGCRYACWQAEAIGRDLQVNPSAFRAAFETWLEPSSK